MGTYRKPEKHQCLNKPRDYTAIGKKTGGNFGLENQSSMRSSAERACAARPSPRASVAAMRPSVLAPACETWISEVRFWKSYTPRGDENLAVRDVGST